MMMNEWPMLILSLAAGAGVGIFFFGGLWWTVRRLPRSSRPVVLTVSSFLVRTGVSVAVFYLLVRGGHWERLLVCLAGFLLIRLVLTRRWSPHKKRKEIAA
ncbi:MAG: ATP synthase subunit I [Candidatus Aminicenantes bacterium]